MRWLSLVILQEEVGSMAWGLALMARGGVLIGLLVWAFERLRGWKGKESLRVKQGGKVVRCDLPKVVQESGNVPREGEISGERFLRERAEETAARDEAIRQEKRLRPEEEQEESSHGGNEIWLCLCGFGFLGLLFIWGPEELSLAAKVVFTVGLLGLVAGVVWAFRAYSRWELRRKEWRAKLCELPERERVVVFALERKRQWAVAYRVAVLVLLAVIVVLLVWVVGELPDKQPRRGW